MLQAGSRQDQAEQLSKSRNKFLATTYKTLFPPLYMDIHICNLLTLKAICKDYYSCERRLATVIISLHEDAFRARANPRFTSLLSPLAAPSEKICFMIALSPSFALALVVVGPLTRSLVRSLTLQSSKLATDSQIFLHSPILSSSSPPPPFLCPQLAGEWRMEYAPQVEVM